jgi:hypothetical protein
VEIETPRQPYNKELSQYERPRIKPEKTHRSCCNECCSYDHPAYRLAALPQEIECISHARKPDYQLETGTHGRQRTTD